MPNHYMCELVMIRFSADESGRNRKLSCPWHGPFRVTSINGPWYRSFKYLLPELILVHQSRVKAYPQNYPGGFYWYGGRRRGVGKPPQWVEDLLADQLSYQSSTANGEVLDTNNLVDEDDSFSEDVVSQMLILMKGSVQILTIRTQRMLDSSIHCLIW